MRSTVQMFPQSFVVIEIMCCVSIISIDLSLFFVVLLGFPTISFSDCFDKIYNSIWHTSIPKCALNRVLYVEYGSLSLRYSVRLRGCNDDLCVLHAIRNNSRSNMFVRLGTSSIVFGWKFEFMASINTYSVIFFLCLHAFIRYRYVSRAWVRSNFRSREAFSLVQRQR